MGGKTRGLALPRTQPQQECAAKETKTRASCAELGTKPKVIVRLWSCRMHFTVEVAVVRLLKADQSLVTGCEEFLVAVLRLRCDFEREVGEQAFQESPDFSEVTPRTFAYAMGQSFYSLSLGMGIIITYGSYVKKEENIVATSAGTAVSDLMFAILAGLAISGP